MSGLKSGCSSTILGVYSSTLVGLVKLVFSLLLPLRESQLSYFHLSYMSPLELLRRWMILKVFFAYAFLFLVVFYLRIMGCT
jgi:hypothetical protein